MSETKMFIGDSLLTVSGIRYVEESGALKVIQSLKKKIDRLELNIACLGQSPQAILWDMINMGRKWGKAEEHIKYYKKQLAEAVKLLQQPKTKEGESYIVILMDWLNDVDDFLESLEKESE